MKQTELDAASRARAFSEVRELATRYVTESGIRAATEATRRWQAIEDEFNRNSSAMAREIDRLRAGRA